MNADQIAEIRPAIREAIDGAPDTCATLEVQGDPGKWMQVADRTINAAYPHEDHPQERLKALPALAGLQVTSWEARKFATFELLKLELSPVAHWVDAYFVAVLGCQRETTTSIPRASGYEEEGQPERGANGRQPFSPR